MSHSRALPHHDPDETERKNVTVIISRHILRLSSVRVVTERHEDV
jgi:hypothetical protein